MDRRYVQRGGPEALQQQHIAKRCVQLVTKVYQQQREVSRQQRRDAKHCPSPAALQKILRRRAEQSIGSIISKTYVHQ